MMDSRSSNFENSNPKRLRKGTHSCFHCRRRKVRCVFEASSLSCNDCLARNNTCTGQDQARNLSRDRDEIRSTRLRVQDLESTIEQLLRRQSKDASTTIQSAGSSALSPAGRPGSQISAPPYSREVLDFSPNSSQTDNLTSSTGFNNAPLLQLFDHDSEIQSVPKTQDKQQDSSLRNPDISSNDERILEYIRSHVPDTRIMRLILMTGRQSSGIWHAAFPTMKDNGFESEDERMARLSGIIYSNLHSEKVHKVAKVTLCLALQLQQLPLSDAVSLPSAELWQHQYISSIETLLSVDEGVAGTTDGLECMIMLIEFYINIGSMQKLWLIMRRAVSLAQLMGVHERTDNRCQKIWSELWQLDRGFSLILGLPYTCPESLLPRRTGLEAFLCHLGTIGGHIIERNLDRSKKMTYSTTIKIDEEIEECKSLLPQSWWGTTPATLDELRSVLVAKMRFFAIHKLLHLPFMLSSYTDSRYVPSRTATLQSAKAMIEVFRVLRDGKTPVIGLCDFVDFQVFSAALTIAVDLLIRGGEKEEKDDDWELIEFIAGKLKRISGTMTCKVAAKGAEVLEMFMKARSGGAAGVLFTAQIPYFGNIRVRIPAATSTVGDAGHNPWISEDSFLYPYGDTQPWCVGDPAMFDVGISDDWQCFLQESITIV